MFIFTIRIDLCFVFIDYIWFMLGLHLIGVYGLMIVYFLIVFYCDCGFMRDL